VTDIPAWTTIATGVVVFAWFALFFVGERLAPAVQPLVPTGLARLGRNAAFWLLNALLSPLAVLPLTAWAAAHRLDVRPQWWAGLPGLALDMLLLDFLIYWWHRANHEWRPLWRFHEVHHLDRFLDSTSAIRFHFGEVLLSAGARAAIVLLLGFPFASMVLFEALLLCATIFHHSNLRLPAGIERALSLVMITPGIHWVHHHAVRADTDANYGTLFSFWDRIFRTRSPTRRTPTMAIGVEGEDERALPALLARPFRRRR
jgi:sterol desaturase/sphingolipid hydroxylase (fatty acid hydroxylase superfamily)